MKFPFATRGSPGSPGIFGVPEYSRGPRVFPSSPGYPGSPGVFKAWRALPWPGSSEVVEDHVHKKPAALWQGPCNFLKGHWGGCRPQTHALFLGGLAPLGGYPPPTTTCFILGSSAPQIPQERIRMILLSFINIVGSQSSATLRYGGKTCHRQVFERSRNV